MMMRPLDGVLSRLMQRSSEVLPGAGRADQHDDFAFADGEVDAANDFLGAEPHADAVEPQDFLGALHVHVGRRVHFVGTPRRSSMRESMVSGTSRMRKMAPMAV